MYLKLSVAGHLTVFLTRTRGPFWSIRPATILLIAVFGTQMLATLVAVYGASLMTPLGWGWALFVWGYALAWFFVNDQLKLLTYRFLDATRKSAPRRQGDGTAAAVKTSPAGATGAKPDATTHETKPSKTTAPSGAPGPKSAPIAEPNAKDALANADPKQQRAALLNMKLSDVLLKAMAKDPKGAGLSIANAISEIEAALIPEPSEPRAQAAAKSEPAPEDPPEQTPRAAE